MTSDPYGILGLPPGASAAEVKRAYRALAKANHPDSAGERALPRFLAIQAAYEQLTHSQIRVGGRARAGSRPTEAWRAEPSRARDARGGARAAGPDRGNASARSRPDGSRTRTEPGTAGARGPAAGGLPGSESPGGGSGRGAGGSAAGAPGRGAGGPKGTGGSKGTGAARRRGGRKATFGSTTYDEAQNPTDPAWQGASWYGPSSGEYWTVNPREYADPRKHGPEYQARAAARAARAAEREAASARDAYASADASSRAEAAARATAASRAATAARAEAERLQREADERAGAEAAAAPPGPPFEVNLGSYVGRLESLPFRRGLLALAAWPPLGIAAASLIGEVTGCAAFSASCTTAATFYPWLAQLAILATLLLLTPLARLLVGGTAAVVILALPVAAALSASGAAYDRVHGPPSLLVLLALAWLGGVVLMAIRLRRSQPAR